MTEAITPWLSAGLSAVQASSTAKKSRCTWARKTFSSNEGSCSWMAAMPASLPSTPSESMLGAQDPGITCPYHSRLGRCEGPPSEVRYPSLALASPWASQSVMSLRRSTSPIVNATGSAAPFFPLARAEDLRDLAGSVIAHEQATVGCDRDRQRMGEPVGKITDPPVLARTRA